MKLPGFLLWPRTFFFQPVVQNSDLHYDDLCEHAMTVMRYKVGSQTNFKWLISEQFHIKRVSMGETRCLKEVVLDRFEGPTTF